MERDLQVFFEHQQDPVATSMAACPAREWDAFISHWRHKVLGDPANEARTILVDDQVAGYLASWERDGKRLVAYWIGREYWGRGVARSALDEFLRAHDHHGPVHAYVALSNVRSIRVLEKCGFQRVGEPVTGSDGVAEVLFLFDGAGPVKPPANEPMKRHRIFTTAFASVYPLYIQKAEAKGRTRQEVDEVICWLTGYSPRALAEQIERKKDIETFFSEAPALHPNAGKITGVICGVRIEEIEDPLMRKIRYLDKLVDELAKGRPMDKILRK